MEIGLESYRETADPCRSKEEHPTCKINKGMIAKDAAKVDAERVPRGAGEMRIP
jgi:hypothetical protein